MARLNSGPQPSESPMDFAYDNGHGPVSADSPFLQSDVNNFPFKDGFAGHKRPSSELDSPTKPSLPALRKPEGQTYLFPTTPSSKVHPAFRAPSFTTPQRAIETDFSSGGDQSSPVNADSEETPDPPSRMGKSSDDRALVQFEGSKSTKKQPSSPLGRLRRQYTDALARRVHKRRRRDGEGDIRSSSRRSSDDHAQSAKSGEGKMGVIPSILTFIDAHPTLPNTLSIYVQFFLNLFLAFLVMYVLFGIFTTIRNDIDEKAISESSEILAEMASCAREFKENRCERETRVPAMESVCNNWEKCMQRDPYKVGRSRLSAGMFAEIFNSFIEPISMKAIIVSITVIIGCFAVNNLTFGLYRAKHPSPPNPSHLTPSQSAVAPHLYVQSPPQIGYGSQESYFTPYHLQQQQQNLLEFNSPTQNGRGYAPEGGGGGGGGGGGRGGSSPRKGDRYR